MSRKKKKSVPGPRRRGRLFLAVAVVAGCAGAVVIAMKTGIFSQGSARGTNDHPTADHQLAAATNSVGNTNRPDLSPESFLAWLSNRTDAVELLNNGTKLLDQGSVTEAVMCYRRALELKPDDEEAHFNLGVAYGRQGKLVDAERHYREALKLFADYVEAHNNLGNVLTRQQRYAEAIDEFKIAIKLSPENASAHNNLGRALAEQGNLAEAVTYFTAATRLDTNYVEAYFNLGTTYLNAGRTNEALAQFNAVLRMRPNFAPALQIISRLQRPVR